jgi:hypothetical protein
MNWLNGNLQENPIFWENLWFPVGFPFKQSIEVKYWYVFPGQAIDVYLYVSALVPNMGDYLVMVMYTSGKNSKYFQTTPSAKGARFRC